MYAIIMLIAILAQYSLGVLSIIEFDCKLLNLKVEVPMEMLSRCWVAISAAYIGVDRASYAIKTSTESYGMAEFGDPSTNRRIILLNGIILFAAFICNLSVDADFQLPSLTCSFGSSITLYCAGQKAIKCTKYVGENIEK